jgi:C4-dicarboxylate-specific signal transduction histidine kinase
LNSDIIEEALDAEEPQLDFIRNTNAINRGTIERISKIVKGLRNFSRDGSKDPLTSILVSKIIEETINLCQEKMKSHGVALKVSEIPIEAEILCRPIEISQVLLNLLNNAHDSVQELAEKWIRIEFEQNEKELCLTVTDSGPRIPADIQKKIFQPFFTTKEIGKGTGLGLSISTGIAFAHGGLLEYDDSCTNAKFILRLPRPSPKRLHSEGA